MAKKLQLSADFQDGYLLYALVSPLVDYRISYFINQKTGMQLKKYEDMPYRVSEEKTASFSWYYYFDEALNTSYYLIASKSKGGFLIPELKQVDYFLLINTTLSESVFKENIKLIRDLQQMYAVLKQDFRRLQNTDGLLESIEMHELAQVVLPSKQNRYKPLKH